MSDLLQYATTLENNRLRDARITALEQANSSGSSATLASPDILYCFNGCWTGSAVIPEANRGIYSRYEVVGATNYWQYYCSQATFGFAAGTSSGAQDTFQAYCCVHNSCGYIGDNKCYSSTVVYNCAGAIAWPFGCDSGCMTACSLNGFHFMASLVPTNACCTDGAAGTCFHYCFATSMNGDSSYCCYGVRNAGRGNACCCAHAACLTGVCFSTPSGGNPFGCSTNIVVLGYGKITS